MAGAICSSAALSKSEEISPDGKVDRLEFTPEYKTSKGITRRVLVSCGSIRFTRSWVWLQFLVVKYDRLFLLRRFVDGWRWTRCTKTTRTWTTVRSAPCFRLPQRIACEQAGRSSLRGGAPPPPAALAASDVLPPLPRRARRQPALSRHRLTGKPARGWASINHPCPGVRAPPWATRDSHARRFALPGNGLICRSMNCPAQRLGLCRPGVCCWGDHFRCSAQARTTTAAKLDLLSRHDLQSAGPEQPSVGQAVCDRIEPRHRRSPTITSGATAIRGVREHGRRDATRSGGPNSASNRGGFTGSAAGRSKRGYPRTTRLRSRMA